MEALSIIDQLKQKRIDNEETLHIVVPYSKVTYKVGRFRDAFEALREDLLKRGKVAILECAGSAYHITIRNKDEHLLCQV